ncbi:hypothetical protein DO72_5168 [Burkholderia pseudomallei]|nr:hypothetical protein DO72_5168 [Burkholderia pseudomallei]
MGVPCPGASRAQIRGLPAALGCRDRSEIRIGILSYVASCAAVKATSRGGEVWRWPDG